MQYLLSLCFFILLLTAPQTHADDNRVITIFRTKNAVGYSASPGENDCALTLAEQQTAHVLEENDKQIKVSFDSPIAGCGLGIPWISRDSNVGWLEKKDISYSGNTGDEDDRKTRILPPPKKRNEPIQLPSTSADCPPPGAKNEITYGARNMTDLVTQIHATDSGMKTTIEANEYLACFPLSTEGQQNFQKYSPFIDNITDSFNIEYKKQALRVQPTLFRCLLRRESGFDPKNISDTGAEGIGQHTDINIRQINSRISNPSTWESKLWKKFFDSVRSDPKAAALLTSCKKSKKPAASYPSFSSKSDAACPLQSLAASAIYNLEIQQALLQNSKVRSIAWNKDLEYQLAIGATYNLGDGAAGKAVNDLAADGWVQAIQNKPLALDKKTEVKNYVIALRNCMETKNQQPMYAKDKPVCSKYHK